MRDRVKETLALDLAFEEYWRMLRPGDDRLPPAVQHHLQKNERIASFRDLVQALDRESARIRADSALAGITRPRKIVSRRMEPRSVCFMGKFYSHGASQSKEDRRQ